MHKYNCLFNIIIVIVIVWSVTDAGEAYIWPGKRAATEVKMTMLDLDNYACQIGSQPEQKLYTPDNNNRRPRENHPEWILWLQDTNYRIGHNAVKYGQEKDAETRYLRIGFKNPITIGSIIAGGNSAVSVLSPDAIYPGNLNNDADWIPATRLLPDQQLTTAQPVDKSVVCWTLPPGIATQAIRFSYTPDLLDTDYAGNVSGLLILPENYENIAVLAHASASGDSHLAYRVNDGVRNHWSTWANRSSSAELATSENAQIVSAENPVYVNLSWDKLVTIHGVGLEFAGLSTAQVQAYVGSRDRHPADNVDTASWQTIGEYTEMSSGYPSWFAVGILRFDQAVTTNGLRLVITEADRYATHEHVRNYPLDGRRVWLDEFMVLTNLQETGQLEQAIKASDHKTNTNVTDKSNLTKTKEPPIPVHFSLPEDGFVTLVIDNDQGDRVRNLIAETFFPAGDHTISWDGADDLTRDLVAAKHGVYHIPARPVSPGTYTVRGLWRKEIVPIYERHIYGAGNPPWRTADNTGAWLADHSPPSAVVFVPGEKADDKRDSVWIGSYIAEDGSGLVRVDLSGNRITARRWIGGNWTGAPYITTDAGPNPNSDYIFYTASVGLPEKRTINYDLRISPVAGNGVERAGFVHKYTPKAKMSGNVHGGSIVNSETQIGGIAVYSQVALVSQTGENCILVVDLVENKIVREFAVDLPGGLGFDAQGNLYVVSNKILYWVKKSDWNSLDELKLSQVKGAELLENPRQFFFTAEAKINDSNEADKQVDKQVLYVSQQGTKHNVAVFAVATPGQVTLTRAIGKPGFPQAGKYDPEHMQRPEGICLDSDGTLWVAERDYVPKRISAWDVNTGQLKDYWLGPDNYGGGGTIDPIEAKLAYYADGQHGTMAFTLDDNGKYQLTDILYRPDSPDFEFPPPVFLGDSPEMPLIFNGQRYFTNAFNASPTHGASVALLFRQNDSGVLSPIVAVGNIYKWPVGQTLVAEKITQLENLGTRSKRQRRPEMFFYWSDQNNNGVVDLEEINLQNIAIEGVTFMPDLSICIARFGTESVRFKVSSMSDDIPVYDFANPEIRLRDVAVNTTSGGNQLLVDVTKPLAESCTVLTLNYGDYPYGSLTGARGDGNKRWSYPSLWPALHNGHSAPPGDQPGMLVATTRVLGNFVQLSGEVDNIWAINGNLGVVYIFTDDGLLVTTLFGDQRISRTWNMPLEPVGMSVADISLGGENFFPFMMSGADNNVYISSGKRTRLIRLDGLDTIKRLPEREIVVTADSLELAAQERRDQELERKARQGGGILTVRICDEQTKPNPNGNLDDWSQVQWVDIDRRGVKAYFNSPSMPFTIQGALQIDNDNLYAAWRTGVKDIADNSGEIPQALFKTGGALDIMLGTDSAADPGRRQPVAGDIRIQIALVKGKVRAVIYRAVLSGTDENARIPYSSPWRTVWFDQVVDVSEQITLATNNAGDFEVSIPLALLGLDAEKIQSGLEIRGDIGVLRGSDGATIARSYWSNKATAITSDVPSEAELVPALWGIFRFE